MVFSFRELWDIGTYGPLKNFKDGLTEEHVEHYDELEMTQIEGVDRIANALRRYLRKSLLRDTAMDVCQYRIHPVGDQKAVGYYIVNGINADEDATEVEYKFIEKVLHIGTQPSDYLECYVIFCVVLTPQSKDDPIDIDKVRQETVVNQTVMIDICSRVMDYYLNICHAQDYVMKQLNDTTIKCPDPVLVLAKLWLLYHQKDTYSILFSHDAEADNDQDTWTSMFHAVDKTIFRNAGTDWIINLDILSSDKANIFAAQINLKQELFDWLRKTKFEDVDEFVAYFKNGKLLDSNLETEYPIIFEFLQIGAIPFSTISLNDVWKQYI